jgi:phage baseplate assembly protein W
MATLKLQTIAQPKKPISTFTYSDLKLDLDMRYTKQNELLKQSEIRDLVLSYDYDAIRNSLFNLFTTIPGQKLLNPLFGLNLMKYVFEPCTKDTAELIGEEIFYGITTFEPRVEVKKIKVTALTSTQPRAADPTAAIDVRFTAANADFGQYNITLIINVPTIGQQSFQLVGLLNNSGFFFNT